MRIVTNPDSLPHSVYHLSQVCNQKIYHKKRFTLAPNKFIILLIFISQLFMAKIILIEDDPSVAILIGDVLQMKGHTVARFSRGADFVTTFFDQCPAIVISDYQLPDVSVYDLFKAVQARYAPESPRFIVISARPEKEVDLRTLEKFNPVFFEKPFLMREFLKTIEEICS